VPITAEPQSPSPLQAVAAFFRRLTAEEYHRLLNIGVLTEGEPVELLEGVMVNKWESFAADPPSLLSISGCRKLTVADYHKMIDAGIVKEGEPVELLEGYLVNKMSRNPPHESSLRRLMNFLPLLLPVGWFSQYQCAIALSESEPEPDGAVLRGVLTDYDGRLPGPGEIGIVIEVAHSSLLIDRNEKGRIYAIAGVPVYWVINVVDRIIEVYTEPNRSASPPAYRTRTDYKPGEQLPIILDGKQAATIPVSDLLP
jgi:Uma2 family endonuclease